MHLGMTKAVIATVSGILMTLLVTIIVIDPYAPTGERGRYASDAVQAALVLAVLLLLALVIDLIRLRRRSLIVWLVLLVGLTVALIPPMIWLLISPGLASTIFQGLGVTSAGPSYGDLNYVLRAVACSNSGADILDPGNTCFPGGTLYGPALAWLGPLSVPPAWSVSLGMALSVLAVLAVWRLARRTPAIGVLALLIGVASPAWVLLIERGNIDAFVLIVAIVITLSWRRWGALGHLTLIVLVVLLAAVKYYPIVLLLGVLPFVRKRIQISLSLGLLLMFAIYLWAFRSDVAWSLQVNSGQATTSNGSIGIRVLAAFGGATSVDEALPLLLLLAITLSLSVVATGYINSVPVVRIPRFAVSAALMGSSLTFVTLIIAGAGFPYKAVFLLLAVPFATYWMETDSRGQRATGFLLLMSIALSQTLALNPITTSLVSLVASSLALGGSLGQFLHQSHWLPFRHGHSALGAASPLESPRSR